MFFLHTIFFGQKKMEKIKKKNLGFIILIILAFLPTLLSINTNLFCIYTSRDNKQGNDTYDKLNIAQENVIWNSTWDGVSGEAIWGNGTYIYTCGSTRSFETIDDDLVIVKWDSNGNKLWNRTWGGPSTDIGYGIWGDEFENIYTCGYTYSFGAGDMDLVLVKWDSRFGNKDWNRTWGGESAEIAWGVWGDGTSIYTCGNTDSFGTGDDDLVLVAWDRFGNKLWNSTWGGFSMDYGFGIWGDGSYIYTCGGTMSAGEGGHDLVLVKWNKFGDLIWYRTWGDPEDNAGHGIWGDGTFIYTCGGKFRAPSIAFLVKWDNAGNQIWNSTWGGPPQVGEFDGVWGDGTYIYTCGSGGGGQILVKWESNEYLEIILNSPFENNVYESGTQIDIDIERELVILESVKYHWDNDPDTEWPEPYITYLPPGDTSHTLYVSATTTTPLISDSKSFTFTTDDTPPSIQILSPTTNEEWDSAPAYDLDITEPHIAQRWYTLNDGPNHYFYSDAGEIDGPAWKALPDGDVTIKFSVSDTLGHTGSNQVIVRKDTKAGQREIMTIIRNAIITGVITGVIGITFWLIKRRLGKRKEKKEMKA